VQPTKQTAPYSDALTLEEARNLFLAANGFSVADYTAPTFTIGFGGLPVKFPNTEERKRVVPQHDLHHVLTGYGTDWIGEAKIGAWELRAGCDSFFAYLLNTLGVVLGLFLPPTGVWRAFLAAKGQGTLYRNSSDYHAILQMTVGEVRDKLGIPRLGNPSLAR
jgi:hypothetical protein